jgi:hypothetical protein
MLHEKWGWISLKDGIIHVRQERFSVVWTHFQQAQ